MMVTMQRILERILIGLAIGVGRNQINGAINRRRQAKGNRARPANYQPRFRRSPRVGPIFWWVFACSTAILILLNH